MILSLLDGFGTGTGAQVIGKDKPAEWTRSEPGADLSYVAMAKEREGQQRYATSDI